jgi:hypothetical protein
MGKTTKGICTSCEKEVGKSAIGKHLQTCPKRVLQDGNNRYFQIRVQDRYLPKYWLYLEASADVTLTELDHFLRDLWLECCGHLSLFIVRDRIYGSSPDEEFGDNSMQIRLGKVLKKDLSFLHEYDIGSTTELSLKGVGIRLGTKPDSPGIELFARNVAPDISCTECGDAEAEYICSECQYEESGWLCDTCAENHKCGEDMLLPVVNSPRTGVCGLMG